MGISRRKFFMLSKRSQRGQGIVEFILILMLGLVLTRFVYFHKDFGLSASIENMMLRLGGFLEKNLKSGTGQNGGSDAGKESTNKFMGTGAWKN